MSEGNKVAVYYSRGASESYDTENFSHRSNSGYFSNKSLFYEPMGTSSYSPYRDTFYYGSVDNALATKETFGLKKTGYTFTGWVKKDVDKSMTGNVKNTSSYKFTKNTDSNGTVAYTASKLWTQSNYRSTVVSLYASFVSSANLNVTSNNSAYSHTLSTEADGKWRTTTISGVYSNNSYPSSTQYLCISVKSSAISNTYFMTLSYGKSLEAGRVYNIQFDYCFVTSGSVIIRNIRVYTDDGIFIPTDGLVDAVELAPSIDTVATSQVFLESVWEANKYTINYDGNGASSGITADSSHIYDTSSSLTINGYTKGNHKFIGWSTTPDGDVVYTDGQSVKNLTAEANETITLYAQWERTEFPRGFYVFTNGEWKYCKAYVYLEKKDLISKDEYEILDANGLELEGDDSWENIR